MYNGISCLSCKLAELIVEFTVYLNNTFHQSPNTRRHKNQVLLITQYHPWRSFILTSCTCMALGLGVGLRVGVGVKLTSSLSGMNSPSLLMELHDTLWLKLWGNDPGGGLGDSISRPWKRDNQILMRVGLFILYP